MNGVAVLRIAVELEYIASFRLTRHLSKQSLNAHLHNHMESKAGSQQNIGISR